MEIWEIGGHVLDRNRNKPYVRNAKGAFLIFDIGSQVSFKHIPDWIKYVDENCGGEPENVCKILIGSKNDIKERNVTENEAKEFAIKNNLAYFECSAKDGKNINEMFTIMANKLIRFQASLD